MHASGIQEVTGSNADSDTNSGWPELSHKLCSFIFFFYLVQSVTVSQLLHVDNTVVPGTLVTGFSLTK